MSIRERIRARVEVGIVDTTKNEGIVPHIIEMRLSGIYVRRKRSPRRKELRITLGQLFDAMQGQRQLL